MYILCQYLFHLLSPLQADLNGGSGTVSLDLERLKSYRVSAVATDAVKRLGAPDLVWLEYTYSMLHPVLQFLPTKRAEYKHVVPDRTGCELHTFGCLEWESEWCRGVMLDFMHCWFCAID